MNDVRFLAGALFMSAAMVTAASEPQPVAQSSETGGAAQVIFVDPNTGEIRTPTERDWAQLPRPAKKSLKAQEHVLPDGTIVIPADAVMHEMTATIGPDGHVETHCTDHPHAAPH